MSHRDVVILGAARTAIGRFGGLFLDVQAAGLGKVAGMRRGQTKGLATLCVSGGISMAMAIECV